MDEKKKTKRKINETTKTCALLIKYQNDTAIAFFFYSLKAHPLCPKHHKKKEDTQHTQQREEIKK